jgi:hypothetical protein
MYLPPGRHDELPKLGLRAWTALVGLIGAGLVLASLGILWALPKYENTSASRIADLQDRAQLQLTLAIGGLAAGLASHGIAWLGGRRTSVFLCGIAVLLLGLAILVMALSF